MKKEIMVRAHQLAKMMEGDYQARLTLALRTIWAEIKKEENGMEELTGSPKQIAWAEDIRSKYARYIPALKEAVEIMKDHTQTESGRYAVDIESDHVAAVKTAEIFVRLDALKKDRSLSAGWTHELARIPRGEGQPPHAFRISRVRYYQYLVDSLETAINTEAASSFWIDRRFM